MFECNEPIQSPGLSPIGGLSRMSQTASAPGEAPPRPDFRTGKDTTSTRHGQSLGHISWCNHEAGCSGGRSSPAAKQSRSGLCGARV